MRRRLITAALLIGPLARPVLAAAPTKAKLDEATKVVFTAYGKEGFDAVYKKVVALLGEPRKKEPNMMKWFGADPAGKCHLFWITKGDKGQAATGTMDATAADCK